MGYYKEGPVRVVLRGNGQDATFFDLANPHIRQLRWNREIIARTKFDRRKKVKRLGFRPTLKLTFIPWSDTGDLIDAGMLSDLTKIANHAGTFLVYPFFAGTVGVAFTGFDFCFNMNLIDSEVEEFEGKNFYHKFHLTFETVDIVTKQWDEDSLNLLQPANVGNHATVVYNRLRKTCNRGNHATVAYNTIQLHT